MKAAFHGVTSRQGISEERINAVETPKWKSKEKNKNQPTKQKKHEKTQENIQRLWGNYKRYRDDTQSLSRMKRKILPKKTLLIKHSKTIHSRNEKQKRKTKPIKDMKSCSNSSEIIKIGI